MASIWLPVLIIFVLRSYFTSDFCYKFVNGGIDSRLVRYVYLKRTSSHRGLHIAQLNSQGKADLTLCSLENNLHLEL